MTNDSDRTQNIPVKLEGGRTIRVEVTQTGRVDVASGASEFKDVTDALEEIVQAIAEPINRANPTKATVKFGLEIAVESGKLIAVLGKGSAKANLEIALEWTKEAGTVKTIG
ncbi:CU044_2847 family protein [Pseudanabaena galeata UHCC 0370]|uniref:CU044_2847 family protein n=1 Tax=Pseudanabaena galeata UHCC 0370 TaxID=3110310 RepID=A0ABU5TMT1_9CYAN|nr:CU044_2847 family protein [Pseudanabaena galeata]MEA5479552.1 CU044_2847 family protein [Pseudanabaena galeata UHCC 0370]